MRLIDLDANFVGMVDFATGDFCEQDCLHGAQGVMFDCQLCQAHSVLCWFNNPINAPKVPDSMEPKPGRWTAIGTNLSDLTLSPSVNLDTEKVRNNPTACKWHGWVKDGDVA
jgi:hypothetical protein